MIFIIVSIFIITISIVKIINYFREKRKINYVINKLCTIQANNINCNSVHTYDIINKKGM